jgi:hypothetical protein
MKKPLAWSLAPLGIAALSLAGPLQAETVYIPILEPMSAAGPLSTQLWISNFDGVARPYTTTFLADREGAEVKEAGATVPADRAMYLSKVAAEGETGLLAVDAEPELAVNAWVQSGRGQSPRYAGLPVISPDTQAAAGAEVFLNGVGRQGTRDVTQLALINLGDAAARCQVDVVAEDGSVVSAAGAVEVPAKSMSRSEDALGLRGGPAVTAKVSCDQPFYAIAALADGKTAQVSFVTPAETIEPAETAARAEKRSTAATGASSLVTFDQAGLFHAATPANPKKIVRVPVPKALDAARVAIEFDVVAGPWNPRLPKGAHNLVFFHRGRFRANTLANINAFGPGNNKAKAAQNLDLPAHYNTSLDLGFVFHQGQTYHVSSLYDAITDKITFGIYQNGHLLKGGQYSATERNHRITVPGSGLVAEFGNYNNQALPEVASLGWRFSNLHVEIVKPN